MSMLISVVVVAAVLSGIVYFLHSNQEKEKLESAERSNPLPPLEKDLVEHVDDANSSERFELTSPSESTPSAPQNKQTEQTKPSANKLWLEQCKEKRDAKCFDEAIALCEPHYPHLNAFKQACLVLRAQIREIRKSKEEAPALKAKLLDLHHVACCAAFFHEKAADLPAPMTANQLKSVTPEQWRGLQSEYESIGFKYIPLLTVTDQKWLAETLGQPDTHQHMRVRNNEIWHQLVLK